MPTTFIGKCVLEPGPSAERPIRFRTRGPKNDDGEFAECQMDLSLDDADELATGLRRAAQWTHEGVWRPGNKSYLDPLAP